MGGRTETPYLIGVTGPAVTVPGRVAAILERHANLSALRVRTRGVDPEAAAVLEALFIAADLWRGSVATGTGVAPVAEPAAPSSRWLSTAETADLLGVTSRAVRKSIARGRLPAEKVDGDWRLDREDVNHHQAARNTKAKTR